MSRPEHYLSYLYPILIEARSGELSQYLEVKKHMGKYLLDSRTVNYSYGGLHKVFDLLFHKINIRDQSFNNVLLLGLGGGSVVSLLTEKYKKGGEITAVEHDAVVIELAKKYFDIQRFNTLSIVKEDAFRYVTETKEKYDLIIVDLFTDNEVPEIFTTSEFMKNLRKVANNRCCVIFNKTTKTPAHKKEFNSLFREFDTCFPGSVALTLVSNGMENSFIIYNTLS